VGWDIASIGEGNWKLHHASRTKCLELAEAAYVGPAAECCDSMPWLVVNRHARHVWQQIRIHTRSQ